MVLFWWKYHFHPGFGHEENTLPAKSEDGVYPIHPQKASQISLSSKACNSVTSSFVFNKTLWHLRLGHPSDQALKHLFPNVKVGLDKYTVVDNSCAHCLYGKMHNLPFPKSQFTTSSPFELIHFDLWGPTPINLINGFKYYVLFIDHFTRFTWIYLLKSKSEVFTKFVQFKALVENQFSAKIKVFRSNGVGEYTSTDLSLATRYCPSSFLSIHSLTEWYCWEKA